MKVLTRQQKHWKISLLFQTCAPIPRACQSSINTTTCIKEIIRSRTIKPMSEKVA
jgi:hypothetical protein